MRMIKWFCLSWVLVFAVAHATTLELTQGHDARLPIAVVRFAGAPSISQVISNDLNHSGQFVSQYQTTGALPHTASAVIPAFWRDSGVNAVVVGRVTAIGHRRYQVRFALINIFSQARDANPVLLRKVYTVTEAQFRQVAHAISDDVYYQLTGNRGAFSSKIAYVLAKHTARSRSYRLVVADYDGANPKTVVRSSVAIMSPRWSPDGNSLAYVSFGAQGSEVFLLNVITGQRTLLLHYPGLNAAPAWSPDGKQMAVTLSRSGSQDIYLLTLADKHLEKLTHDSAIDTEPTFMPDGKSLLFVSNRQGSPEIYQFNLSTGSVTRLTYNGKYNVTPQVMPDGKSIVMIHTVDQGYTIAKQSLSDGVLMTLTDPGMVQSPSIAPNGSMILYSNQAKQGTLAIVSSNGKAHFRLPAADGNLQEPAWSPFSE